MTFRQRRIVILDIVRLQRMVGFNPNYLHLPAREGASAERRPRQAQGEAISG